MEDVYIVVMQGPYWGAVTICKPSNAASMARQLRQGGRKVKIYRSHDEYLTALHKVYNEYRRNTRLQARDRLNNQN